MHIKTFHSMNCVDLPKVSVVTVVYNGRCEIEKTILSVLNQNYSNIEYIIIDGGSTDGTVEIIRKYQDRLAYWVSEPDGGIYYAMNKGIKKATGEWIHFRNCGDYFFDVDALTKMFSPLIDDDVMLLHGDCRVIKKNGYIDMQPPILSRSYKKGMPIFHPSTFVRLSFHILHPFNTSYKSSSDYEFVYMAIKHAVGIEYRPYIVSIYNSQEGFSVANWKLAVAEVWDWKYPKFPLKKIFLKINIRILELRKGIAKMRHKF